MKSLFPVVDDGTPDLADAPPARAMVVSLPDGSGQPFAVLVAGLSTVYEVLPRGDVAELPLPSGRCQGYMPWRREERGLGRVDDHVRLDTLHVDTGDVTRTVFDPATVRLL